MTNMLAMGSILVRRARNGKDSEYYELTATPSMFHVDKDGNCSDVVSVQLWHVKGATRTAVTGEKLHVTESGNGRSEDFDISASSGDIRLGSSSSTFVATYLADTSVKGFIVSSDQAKYGHNVLPLTIPIVRDGKQGQNGKDGTNFSNKGSAKVYFRDGVTFVGSAHPTIASHCTDIGYTPNEGDLCLYDNTTTGASIKIYKSGSWVNSSITPADGDNYLLDNAKETKYDGHFFTFVPQQILQDEESVASTNSTNSTTAGAKANPGWSIIVPSYWRDLGAIKGPQGDSNFQLSVNPQAVVWDEDGNVVISQNGTATGNTHWSSKVLTASVKYGKDDVTDEWSIKWTVRTPISSEGGIDFSPKTGDGKTLTLNYPYKASTSSPWWTNGLIRCTATKDGEETLVVDVPLAINPLATWKMEVINGAMAITSSKITASEKGMKDYTNTQIAASHDEIKTLVQEQRTGRNLWMNGDFEMDPNGDRTPKYTHNGTASDGCETRIDDVDLPAGFSKRLVFNCPKAYEGIFFAAGTQPYITKDKLNKDNGYCLSFYVKSTKECDMNVGLESLSVATVHVKGDWQRIAVYIPANLDYTDWNGVVIFYPTTALGTKEYVCITGIQFEIGTENSGAPTVWSQSFYDTQSAIEQKADSISLSITNDINGRLKKTGIYLDTQKIVAQGDNFVWQDTSGNKLLYLDSNGANFSGNVSAKTISTNSGKFKVDSDGKLTAVDANIRGKITADSGDIGQFHIDSRGLYNGDKDYNTKWFSNTDTNFFHIGYSALWLQQAIGYFQPGDLAKIKVGIGAGSDPTSQGNKATYCASAMYIYRKMDPDPGLDNDTTVFYNPAVQIISDNVYGYNIAMRVVGGLQVHGGLIEHGYGMDNPSQNNILNLSKGTKFLLYTSLTNKPSFFLPTLTEVRTQIGIKSTTETFCVRVSITARRDTSAFFITTQYKAAQETAKSKEEGGVLINNNGGEWGNSMREMNAGDCIVFDLCYSLSTGYYAQVVSLQD